jgi:hypothetical protein
MTFVFAGQDGLIRCLKKKKSKKPVGIAQYGDEERCALAVNLSCRVCPLCREISMGFQETSKIKNTKCFLQLALESQ